MTEPMTPARLEEIRRELSGARVSLACGDDRQTARDLLAEVERLRALPVMDVCARCDDCYQANADGSADCMHPSIGYRATVANAAPPSWCPLRGGAR